jgi:BRO1-like domain
MLIIPLKCPPRYDLREPLARWLDGGPPGTVTNPLEFVHLRPDFKSCDCHDEIIRLASIRNCLSDSIAKPLSHKVALEDFALQDCHEYHAALLEFIKRGFPTRDEVTPSLKLSWKAAIGPQTETHGSLEWDRACTIWNIAALESYLASIQTSDKEGRKQAVKHCQTAASMMRYLHDEVVDGQGFETVDLSKPCLKFWEHCMLAHAQLATYQLATCGETVKSMLATGAVPLFNEALQYSKHTLLVSHQLPTEEWSVHCKAWSMLLTSKAAHHQAMACQETHAWGYEIGWLQETVRSVTAANEFCSKNYTPLEKEISEMMQTVRVRLAQASKDNTGLYGEEIPTFLPNIQPKQLVKSDGQLPNSMLTPKKALF